MFDSLLVANRGEIACRVIRTARRMGLRTIAVYSDADEGALHVMMADETVRIGPPPAPQSYLNASAILDAAKATKAAAIHPGYGFLSENADFADACAAAGIVFVGPSADAIRAMGLKDGAKALMEKAGVPVVPGFHGDRQAADFLKKKAYETGYPVLIKAVAGGGGKGMRRVDKAIDFDEALAGAVREAEAAFGDPRVLIEKFVAAPRHIEVQVMGDTAGTVVHLFERDCSLQRRHQKVIEEAPAPGMTPGLRARMGEAAVKAADAVRYTGAGTVEFIVDASKPLHDETPFYFMEMNTRLQVEHPVTEAITGLDLVELQLRVAAGEPLPFAQDDLAIDGHAVEARLYAEDPDDGFLPSVGTLEVLALAEPEGVRIDTGVRQGDAITPFYDPMIAKIIAHGGDRDTALDRLSGALGTSSVAGPKSNLAVLKALADSEDFRQNRFNTGTIDKLLPSLLPPLADIRPRAARLAVGHLVVKERARLGAMVRARSTEIASPWDTGDGFQLSGRRVQQVPINVDGAVELVTVEWGADGPYAGTEPDGTTATFIEADNGVHVLIEGRQFHVHPPLKGPIDGEGEGDGAVVSPMHGKVVEIAVSRGDIVTRGDKIAVVEAMKMEHTVAAPIDGVVTVVAAVAGDQVEQRALLVTIEPSG